MRPTRFQYFIAQRRPESLCVGTVTSLLVFVVVRGCNVPAALMGDWRELPWLVVVLVLVIPTCLLCASVGTGLLLSPFYDWRAHCNGAPCQPGDYVRILVGPHRDRVCRVVGNYLWNCVQVDLGDVEFKGFENVLMPYEVLRDEGPAASEAPEPPVAS
jgi:hypothetical protein